MIWLVDRDDKRALDDVVDEVTSYVRRHGDDDQHDHRVAAVVSQLLDGVCRCGGAEVRVELEWAAARPTITVVCPDLDVAHDEAVAPGGCDARVAATLLVRRRSERSFVLGEIDPNALPRPEEVDERGDIGKEPFLRALLVHATREVERAQGPEALDEVITRVGGNVGNRIEDEYRRARGIVERLTPEQMADLFVSLKQAIDGDFYVVSVDDREIVLGNRRCPFGDAVRESPGLCRMTSSVFGGIAARNAGHSAVCLDERIAIGDTECTVRVLLRPDGVTPPHAHHYGTRPAVGHGPLRIAMVDRSLLMARLIGDGLAEEGVEVVASTCSVEELLEQLPRRDVDVVLIDQSGRRSVGDVAAVQALRRAHPDVGVVLVVDEADAAEARRLLSADTRIGYLLRNHLTDMGSFAATLRTVAGGGSVIDTAVSISAMDDAGTGILGDLTDRELEVLALMADGLTNQGIAQRLVVSKRAVEKHVQSVFAKLDIDEDQDRRVQAVLLYREASLR